MNLEQTFEVHAPIDAVWHALNDPERIAPCLAGATITGQEDGAYQGEFTLRVGPFSAVHKGTIRVEAADEVAHVNRIAVVGASTGSGATIVNTLTDCGSSTRVVSVAELTIAGALAGFVGPTVINDITSRLLRDFATCLSSRLAEPEPEPEAASA